MTMKISKRAAKWMAIGGLTGILGGMAGSPYFNRQSKADAPTQQRLESIAAERSQLATTMMSCLPSGEEVISSDCTALRDQYDILGQEAAQIESSDEYKQALDDQRQAKNLYSLFLWGITVPSFIVVSPGYVVYEKRLTEEYRVKAKEALQSFDAAVKEFEGVARTIIPPQKPKQNERYSN